MEILTESSSMSPRISFSYDLALYDAVPVEQRHFRSDSIGVNSGFEFHTAACGSLKHESCSADELFSEGKIIPGGIKKKTPTHYSDSIEKGVEGGHEEVVEGRHASVTALRLPKQTTKQTSVKQRSETEEKQSSSSKSFWRFRRSSSLNCGSGYGRKLCVLPLLSRSNSTGSAEVPLTKSTPSPPPTPLKPLQDRFSKGHHQRQRPPLRRSGVASTSHGGSSLRVNPALNVHSGNLFGLGSIIFSGKDKNSRK